jgi:hypothetical protein
VGTFRTHFGRTSVRSGTRIGSGWYILVAAVVGDLYPGCGSSCRRRHSVGRRVASPCWPDNAPRTSRIFHSQLGALMPANSLARYTSQKYSLARYTSQKYSLARYTSQDWYTYGDESKMIKSELCALNPRFRMLLNVAKNVLKMREAAL